MKKPRSKTRTAMTALVLVAIAVPALLLVRLFQAPSVGNVVNNDPAVPHFDASNGTHRAMLKGVYFSLDYDSSFSDVTNISTSDPNSLEQYRLHKPGQSGQSIVLSIRNLPAGGLKEDASYRLRKSKPAEYTETNVAVGSATATLMRKNTGEEVVAFLPHGKLLATVAVEGTTPDADLTEPAITLLKSMQWRN